VPAPGRYDAAGVVGSDNQFWLIGGSDSNNLPIANNDAFNPSTNFWDSYAPLQTPRSQLASGRLGNLIHIAGGLDSPSTITASHDAYDVTSNTWTHIDDAPYAFTGAMGIGYAGTGKFYVFGGQTSPFTTTNQVLIYDPGAGNWSYGAPMPAERSNGAVAEWGGKIYLFGGADNNRNFESTLWEYDPAANTWTPKASAPVARFQPGMSARNGKLYVSGGGQDPNDPFVPSGTVDVYDIGTNTWGGAANMIYSKVGHAQGTLNDGRIIVATGILTTSFRSRFTELLPPEQLCTTPTPTATASASSTSTPTQATTNTSTPTQAVTVTSTPCAINFADVHETDYFYEDVRCVYCLGAVSGYSDGTFRPFNNTTRGQMTKIIVLALRIPIATPSGTPTFNDVAPGSAFYDYVETAAGNNIVSGYADGTFRPNNNVTRGQLSKIVVTAAGHVFNWTLLNPAQATFSDVPVGSAFFTYVETAVCRGVISGYSDHTFRPSNNAIRAQIAKIVCRTSENPIDTCSTR
jgi:hypothetical protein